MNSSALIGWNYSIQTGEQNANLVKDFFKINFPPMRALKFITGHVIYNLAYTYKFRLKTTTTTTTTPFSLEEIL